MMALVVRHLSLIFGIALLVFGTMHDNFGAQFLGIALLGVFNIALSNELGKSQESEEK